MIPINDPIVIAEVTEAFHAYEQALVNNDVPTLQTFFWDSPHACRYGATEELYGYEEIAAFRKNRVINFKNRRSKRLEIISFGYSLASAMYEYTSETNGQSKSGRQSQTWIKLEDDWKIASAHVSFSSQSPQSEKSAASKLTDLGIEIEASWEYRISQSFSVTQSLANRLMNFELPETTEPAPIFKP